MALGRENLIDIPTVTGQAEIEAARAKANAREMKVLQPKKTLGEWFAGITKGHVEVASSDQTTPPVHTEFKE